MKHKSLAGVLGFLATSTTAHATQPAGVPEMHLNACWAGIFCQGFISAVTNVNYAMLISVSSICLAIFIIGAFMMVISAGRDTLLQNGKSMMIGSLIGLIIVVGASAIWRTVIFVLYSG